MSNVPKIGVLSTQSGMPEVWFHLLDFHILLPKHLKVRPGLRGRSCLLESGLSLIRVWSNPFISGKIFTAFFVMIGVPLFFMWIFIVALAIANQIIIQLMRVGSASQVRCSRWTSQWNNYTYLSKIISFQQLFMVFNFNLAYFCIWSAYNCIFAYDTYPSCNHFDTWKSRFFRILVFCNDDNFYCWFRWF